MNNKKEQHAFALFFLLFLAVSSFPVLFYVFQNSRNFIMKTYNSFMIKRNIQIIPPLEKIKTPYGEEALKPQSMMVLPKNNIVPKSGIMHKKKAIASMVGIVKRQITSSAINFFTFRDELSTFNMAFKYHIGMKMPIIGDSVFLLPNGKIAQTASSSKSFFTQDKMNKFLKYKKLCDEFGVNFFVVFRPRENGFHHDYSEPYRGLILDCYQKADSRSAQLEKSGVKTFKLYNAMRKEIPEDKWLNYWYMTDHHWNVDGALAGGKLIADYMNRNCGTSYDLAYFDPKIYTRKRYKNLFIGSMGKKTSLSYANGKKDDVDILLPQFSTDFTLTIPRLNLLKRGDFSCFINYSAINYDAYHAYPYGIFLFRDKPFIRIINNKIPTGKKIIVIKDSYSNAMIPYLALQTEEIIMIDPRHYPEKDIWDTIKKEKPDILFIMFGDGI